MNLESKNERIRRCATCGKIHGADTTNPYCRKCGGPMVRLGPIEWSEKDEIEVGKEFVGIMEDMEQEEEEFQDVVCLLWDEIEASEDLIDEKDDEIEGLKAEIVIHKNAVKMVDDKVKELEAKLADETLTGKVKKAFGTE